MIKNGHRDIGFVGTPQATSSIMDRYLGFTRAMLMHGLPVHPEWIIPDRSRQGIIQPLQLPETLPTALVCNCDRVAHDTIAALHERGYRVPEDISVVGYDDFSSGGADSNLSTFRPDVHAMCQMAVQMASDRCAPDGKEKPFRRVVVGGQPVYRQSEKPLIASLKK